MTAPTWSLCPYVRKIFHVCAQHGEVDITISVAKGKVCVSSPAPGMRRQDALRWASGCKIGVKCQLVDGRLISTRRQVGLMNLMLSHACKWHGATLRVQIVNLTGILKNEGKTYTVRQTDNGIYCAVTLKEVVAVWIVVLAHELDILRCGTRVTTRGNLPPCGIGDVRN